MIVACLDIGSTWTKGLAFRLEGESVTLLKRASRPTTVANLADGFFAVLGDCVSGDPLALLKSGELKLQYSSSAKGGLAVAAIGLVPEVTLEVGKIAAQSAGARLSQVFSYHLTRRDIAGLEASPPDTNRERLLAVAGASEASRRAEASLSSCAKPISAGYEAFSSLTNSGSICAGSSYCANMPFFLADVGADHHNSKSVSYDCFCVFFAGHFAGLA